MFEEEVRRAEEEEKAAEEKFKVVGIVFLGIVVSLFTHPIHHKEAAWFMLIGMFVFSKRNL